MDRDTLDNYIERISVFQRYIQVCRAGHPISYTPGYDMQHFRSWQEEYAWLRTQVREALELEPD